MNLTAGTAFVGGLLTFASPCVLPLIPIYLSVLLGSAVEEVESAAQRFRLLRNGALFVLGFMLVFTALGLTASAAGQFLVQHRLLFQQLGGLLVFFFALKFLGLIRQGVMDSEKRFQLRLGQDKGISAAGAFLIGLTFAFGWTPCISPILGSILMVTAVSGGGLAGGAWLLFLYSLGIALPLLVVAACAHSGTALLRKVNRFIPRIEKATGVVLAALSVLMVTDSVSLLSFEPRGGSSARISTDIVRKSRESSLEQTAAKSAESSPVPGSTALPAGRGGTASPSVPGEADSANATGGPSAAGPSAQQCTAESSSCGIGGEPGEQETSVDVAALTRGPRVIEFYKPDCPACLRMVPVLQGLHETCSGLGLDLVQLDVSLPENRAVAARLGVVGTPTLLFFDGTGQELSRLIGYQELDAVRRAAAILMGEQCAEFLPLD